MEIISNNSHTCPVSTDTKLWTYTDLSGYLGRSENTLRKDVMHDRIPYIKVGRLVRFNPEAIAKWLEEKQIQR